MFKGKVSYSDDLYGKIQDPVSWNDRYWYPMTMPPPKKGLTSLERLYIIDELYKGFLLMSVKKDENGVWR